MNDSATSAASAATRILLTCSFSESDGEQYFRSVEDAPDYYISRSGQVYSSPNATADPITIMLANVGPVMLRHTQAFSIRLDSHSMPEPDTSRPSVPRFYEFCQYRKFLGFQHFESYTAPQLSALQSLLNHIIPNTQVQNILRITKNSKTQYRQCVPGIYLHSLVANAVLAPHPQIDLIKIFINVDQ